MSEVEIAVDFLRRERRSMLAEQKREATCDAVDELGLLLRFALIKLRKAGRNGSHECIVIANEIDGATRDITGWSL